MKQVYQSKDGKVFDTEQECLKHEQKTDIETKFEKWYFENKLYNSDSKLIVDTNNVLDWLLENKEEIVNFLFHKDFSLLQELKNLVGEELDNILKKEQDVENDYSFFDVIDDITELKEKISKIKSNLSYP